MNYSTLKKTVALSFASLLVAGMVNAQTDSTTKLPPQQTQQRLCKPLPPRYLAVGVSTKPGA
jgi:OOP family OmpA-OmpF porin